MSEKYGGNGLGSSGGSGNYNECLSLEHVVRDCPRVRCYERGDKVEIVIHLGKKTQN